MFKYAGKRYPFKLIFNEFWNRLQVIILHNEIITPEVD
jgi:hypothetical protein